MATIAPFPQATDAEDPYPGTCGTCGLDLDDPDCVHLDPALPDLIVGPSGLVTVLPGGSR